MSLVLGCLCVPSLSCGPESTPDPDWIVGIYSVRSAGEIEHNGYVANYEFRGDGTVVRTGQDRCGIVTLEPEEQTWKAAGAAIEVAFVGGELDGKTWRITPGEDCNQIRVRERVSADHVNEYTLTRGEVCVGPELGCSEGECFCETFYCDAAPAACEE